MRLSTLAWLILLPMATVAQDPIPGAQDPFPHVRIVALGDQITKLGSSGMIPARHAPQLKRPLTQSLEDLQSAQPLLAIQHLEVFKNKVGAQVAPELKGSLIAQAGSIQNQISGLAGIAVAASITPCLVPKAADFRSLAVGPGETLTTISGALAYASAQGFIAVEIVLAPTIHREDLITIDRHTRLIAPAGSASIVGRIVNIGPYLLEMQNVVVAQSAGTGLYINNGCAVTVLNNVDVRRTDGIGIWQRSGSFTADDLTVTFSSARAFASATDRHAGRALRLSDGVRACMTDVILDRNDGGALLAEGYLTRVFASRLTAQDNRVNPIVRVEMDTIEGPPPVGSASVEIRDQALFLGDWLTVDNGEVMGLLVENGGSSQIRGSVIQRSYDAGLLWRSGINIMASSGGNLELNSVRTADSGLGINMHFRSGAAVASYGLTMEHNRDLAYSILTNSGDESYCATQCNSDHWDFRQPRSNTGVTNPRIPIYTEPPLGDGFPVCGACISVPFAPSWCDAL